MGEDKALDDLNVFWNRLADEDPLWAILSDPSKRGRKWRLPEFFETGRREISILMYQLEKEKISVRRGTALDFGCGLGRLTRALGDYFDSVWGVDVSLKMVDLANRLNQGSPRLRFLHNPYSHLRCFTDGQFDFLYSNIVLQHVRPEITMEYLPEFLRILAPGGLLIFQLPSRKRRPEEIAWPPRPLPEDAYRAGLRLADPPAPVYPPATDLPLQVLVRNDSAQDWVQDRRAPLRVGNHWLGSDGKTMLVQDDGRTELPGVLPAHEECLVPLTVKTPEKEGTYRCEIDLVHESFSWFKDKGSIPHVFEMRIESAGSSPAPPVRGDIGRTGDSSYPDLDELIPVPGGIGEDAPERESRAFPMHGIPRETIEAFFLSRGALLVKVEPDEHGGTEWEGCRYIFRK